MASELARHVGARITQARKEKGWKQRELADAMDVKPPLDKQRISDWERGVHQPNERNLKLIAEALDRDLAWFYADDNAGETPNLIETMANADQAQLDRIERKIDTLLQLASGKKLTASAIAEAAGPTLREFEVQLAQAAPGAQPQPDTRQPEKSKRAPGRKRARRAGS